ncbi:LytR C-terminal domain-containing protein [uncultured Bifidobacterium sp.]|uniref:LytR C-terminal domain-containing protein n=1 Tax=uncultured Bifidobacterium sp. TaxID=165187 RepID=UPI00262261D8|nr:LytR C-terminal domain-containing protein [uncultured Bifidobacterium sp.]
MARNERNNGVIVDRDAFDDPPAGPVGTHRGNRPFLVRLSPVLISVVVAALVGLLVWAVYSGQISHVGSLFGSSSSQATTASSSAMASSSSSASATSSSASTSSSATSSTATSSSTATQSQTGTVDKSTSVRVVNATGVAGYAATKASVLEQAGYTNVTAANPTDSSTLPDQTVVWYQSSSDEATAKSVADSLGITSVQQEDGLVSPIVVVLIN